VGFRPVPEWTAHVGPAMVGEGQVLGPVLDSGKWEFPLKIAPGFDSTISPGLRRAIASAGSQMVARQPASMWVIAVVWIMVVSSIGLLAVGSGGSTHATGGPHRTSLVETRDQSSPSVRPLAPSAASSLVTASVPTAVNPAAQAALAQAREEGIPTRDVFVPRASASPAQLALSVHQGHVTPLYSGTAPAPIGLADYGLAANPNGNGSIVPSILNAPRLKATFDPNATGVQPLYPFSSTPDGFGVQLNAVTTNISLVGLGNYSFWTQNVVEYLAQSHTMYIVSNVWNFSGGGLSPNVFFAHGANGTQVGTTFYYSEIEVPTPVTYPFNLTLWMNNSVIAGRNAVNFTVALNDSGVTTVYPYDFVIFNSTTATSGPATLSTYTANGYTLNPIGLTDDFEVILGGPGGGSQANLYTADANLTLQYWNSTTDEYAAVPSAFSYGGETGETVTGAYVGWQNGTHGAPVGLVRTGPSQLNGLWNATGAPGLGEVDFTLSPSNLWLFVAPNWTSNFTYEGQANWAPQEMTGGTFWLAPGNYNFSAMLSDYTAIAGAITVNLGVTFVSLNLPSNPSLGIYTPLWVWNNAQFAGISTSGSGTASDPYQIVNSQSTVMPEVFGTWNDFTFPVFTGVFFLNTNASVVLAGMAPLLTVMPYPGVTPLTNSLGYLLYNASHVALVNSTNISGWYSNQLYDPIDPTGAYAGNYYGTFSAVLWNSSDNLIANDTFGTLAAGLSLYGGTNNTVWGNTFTMAPYPSFPNPSFLNGLNLSLGLQEGESGDLVYGNAFDTTVTAVTVPADLYTGAPLVPVETWNITPTPRTTVNFAAGFPDFPLTGTIVGNATQGGNFWYDYGGASNPLGVLPYSEVVNGVSQILVGGDAYPLIPPVTSEYLVRFSETGLTAGTSWSVDINGSLLSGTAATLDITLANATYPYTVTTVSGYSEAPTSGNVTVTGANVLVPIVFTPTPRTDYTVVFSEAGLASGTNWSVTLNSVPKWGTTASLSFSEPNGSYSWTLGSVAGFTGAPPSGSVTVDGQAISQSISFSAVTPQYTLTFVETGLPAGTPWSVTLGFTTNQSTTSEINFTVTPQVYGFVVGSVAGYLATPSSSSVAVVASNVMRTISFARLVPGEYTITYTESGLATGTNWSVTLGSTTKASNGTTTVFSEMNGSYTYSIASVTGYLVTPNGGPVTVEGANQQVTVKFTSVSPGKYALTFTESGLPNGSNWSVTLGGVTGYSDGGMVVSFQEANNSYTYQIGARSGYSATPSTGVITLSGAAKNVLVTFVPNTPSTTPSSGGLTTLEWGILAAVILLVVIAVVALLVRRGRGGAKYDAASYENPEGEEPGMGPSPPVGPG
jgi:thermopsin